MSEQDRLVAGRFRLIRRLGSGAMASVFLAEDCDLGRRVAIKRLHPEASSSEVAPRFRREMRVAASLSHPGVVTLYDAIEDHGDVLLIMEFVDGPTLAQRMARSPLEPAEALRILRALADAIDHLHARGIIHRDVKPANILLDRAGNAKLTDLGIASAAQTTGITTSGTILGTPAYMAPELFEGERATPAADVYSLAALAFEMLTGRRARRGGTPAVIAMRATTEPPPDLREVWPEAGPLAAALERGMARRPEDRPETATALVDAIEGALGEHELPATEVLAGVDRPPAPAPQRTAAVAVERGRGVAREGDGARDGDGAPAARPAPPPPARAARERPRRDDPPRRDDRPRRRGPTVLLAAAAVLAVGAIAAVLVAGGGGGGAGGAAGDRPGTSTRARTARTTDRTSSAASTPSSSASSTPSSSASSTPTTSASTAPSTSTSTGASTARAAAPSSPAGAVQAFYGRAAAHRYAEAWALAAPGLRSQLGGYGAFQRQFSSVRSIVFARASTVRRSASAATVAIATTATHTDHVDHCTGTADTVPGSGGGWVVTHLAISCGA